MTAFEEPRAFAFAPVRVLTVDDNQPFRAVLRRLVEAAYGLIFLAEADSGEGAVALVGELEADMVVMDVVMPGIGGITATRRIKAERPATVVVLVSATHPDDLPSEAAYCGADEVVWKSELRPGLLESIWSEHCAAT